MTSSVLLDTHAWLWLVDSPEFLSPGASKSIESADRVLVSSISCLEVGTLVALGRIALDRDIRSWVRRALARPRVESISLDADLAVDASQLDRRLFPTDPVDQLIYVTARRAGAMLITKDRRIRAYDPRGTLW